MKKRNKILLIVLVVLIPIVWFVVGRIKNSAKDALLERWKDVNLPQSASVKEEYSDVGFHGEGSTILKVEANEKDIKGTDLERGKDIDVAPRFSELVENINEKSKMNIELNNLEYVSIHEKKEKSGKLVFTYSEKDKCYYLFEDK